MNGSQTPTHLPFLRLCSPISPPPKKIETPIFDNFFFFKKNNCTHPRCNAGPVYFFQRSWGSLGDVFVWPIFQPIFLPFANHRGKCPPTTTRPSHRSGCSVCLDGPEPGAFSSFRDFSGSRSGADVSCCGCGRVQRRGCDLDGTLKVFGCSGVRGSGVLVKFGKGVRIAIPFDHAGGCPRHLPAESPDLPQ